MKTLNLLATALDRFVWTVGVFAILGYTQDHWPTAYSVVSGVFLAGFGFWYFWKFFVKPFRAGLGQ